MKEVKPGQRVWAHVQKGEELIRLKGTVGKPSLFDPRRHWVKFDSGAEVICWPHELHPVRPRPARCETLEEIAESAAKWRPRLS